MLKTLRSFLINAPPILTSDLKLGNLRRNNHNDFVYSDYDQYMGKYYLFSLHLHTITKLPNSRVINNHILIGLRFNDEIYFYMSRGLIDPTILESLPNQQALPAIIVGPSMILKEAWESQEYKDFYHQVFNNLHEDTD